VQFTNSKEEDSPPLEAAAKQRIVKHVTESSTLCDSDLKCNQEPLKSPVNPITNPKPL
jgi:hypothetical protein